ncbi:unnamed protein product, partial [Rotaria magnacalcarata]
MVSLKKTRSAQRRRIQAEAIFEHLSNEIIFDIFDYLMGNEICKSFYGLNSRFSQLVCNTPNVHLDLSRTKTKFFQTFQQIFCEENVTSVELFYDNISILESFMTPLRRKRFKSISLLDLPVQEFENQIPAILNNFKDDLISFKIRFSDMECTTPGERAALSFAYLLTEMPSLKYLTLEHSKGIDPITYMHSNVINNTIINLTISLFDIKRLIPLLYRFQKLNSLTMDVHKNEGFGGKRALPPEAVRYYKSLINEKTSMEYPAGLRHVKVYQYPLTEVETIERLLQFTTSNNLLTYSLFACERPLVKIPVSRRQPPFLDGKQYYDLVRKYLPTTLKRFHVEYNVDGATSRTKIAQ